MYNSSKSLLYKVDLKNISNTFIKLYPLIYRQKYSILKSIYNPKTTTLPNFNSNLISISRFKNLDHRYFAPTELNKFEPHSGDVLLIPCVSSAESRTHDK